VNSGVLHTRKIPESYVAELHSSCVWRICLLPILIEIEAIETAFGSEILPKHIFHISRASGICFDECNLVSRYD